MKLKSILVLLIFTACNDGSPEFKKINSFIDFKYIQFGEGETINFNDYIEINLSILDTLGDTLHYVPDFPYFLRIEHSSLDSAWQSLQVGDSVCFRLPRSQVNQFYKFYEVLQSDEGKVLLHARIKSVYDSLAMVDAKRKALSRRELEEQRQLNIYLKANYENLDTLDGAYRIFLNDRSALNDSIRNGSEVSIHYKGRFLNGYVFDNTYEKGITPTFTFGKEYQMIDGMKIGINGLKEGEKVKIIVPSRRAFGEEGSLAGIVPPYTATIFEVEIIKVNN